MFEKSAYTVNEDAGEVIVCVQLVGERDLLLTVNITTVEDDLADCEHNVYR